jgi:hypothetical protein
MFLMSERTEAALARADELLSALNNRARSSENDALIGDVTALRRAIAAFHMEGIRFRMYSADRALTKTGNEPALRELYEGLRQALEAAGFHTRSHTAP